MGKVEHARHIRYPILRPSNTSASILLLPKRNKRVNENALVGGRHRRPHHHRVLIDTNLPILQQHGREMPQHRLFIRHRHAVPAKLHPVQVERPGGVVARSAKVPISVEAVLGRVGCRHRGGG